MMFIPHRKHIFAPSRHVRWHSFTVVYVDNVHTSQETPPFAVTPVTGTALLHNYVRTQPGVTTVTSVSILRAPNVVNINNGNRI
jgi:hypothetical protein